MSPALVRLCRPFRLRRMRNKQRVVDVEIRGLERLQKLVDEGAGILICPNHAGDGDVDAVYSVSDHVGRPFHFMAAWQVFIENGRIGSWFMQRHGAFSVDREGTDTRALKHSVQLLEGHPCPLVIFPEGEVYHLNDRVMPFRQGPAAIALMAARKSERPIYVLPAAVKFFYVQDPTPKLIELMNDLEVKVLWRPRPDLPLTDRIYRFAEGLLALKELEYRGRTSEGPLPERVTALAGSILQGIEQRYELNSDLEDFPDRVKRARQKAIKGVEEADNDESARKQYADDLDDLFLVCQLFSYPGDYLKDHPTIERVAETLDKFEEDVIGRSRPEIRGDRRAVISFGEPIPVPAEKGKKDAAAELTREMETRVQALLDAIGTSGKQFAIQELIAEN